MGKYLGIEDINNNFKDFLSQYTHPRSDLKGVGLTASLGRTKNPNDIFINLDGSIGMVVQSKKLKAVALGKWFTKKGMEKYKKNINKPLKKKMQQLYCLMMT